jgi:hypothetical protein
MPPSHTPGIIAQAKSITITLGSFSKINIVLSKPELQISEV